MQGRRAKVGLTREQVVDAALDVLDEGGLENLSTRAIAAELGVSMNTVMWHIHTKDQLLELMAESIVGEVDLANLRGTWHEQAAALLQRLRQAMLGHRDGAMVVAGTFPAMTSTLAFGDRLVGLLIKGFPTLRSAAWTTWSLFYFTLGHVQEEQRAPTTLHDRMPEDMGEHQFPNLHAVLEDFLSVDYDARFTFGVEQILRSADSMPT